MHTNTIFKPKSGLILDVDIYQIKHVYNRVLFDFFEIEGQPSQRQNE